MARSRTGWPWPCTAVHQEAIASSTSAGSPSAGSITVNQAPLAPTATTGGNASAPMVLYGCQTCAVSMALIWAGVSSATERQPSALLIGRADGIRNVSATGFLGKLTSTMMTLAPARSAPVTDESRATLAAMGTRKSGFYRHDLDGLRGIA